MFSILNKRQYMSYMYKETPEATLLVNFGLFRENFVTSSVYSEINLAISLSKNFMELFSGFVGVPA